MNILLLTYQGNIAGSTFSISYLAKGLSERGHNVFAGCRKESMLWDLLEDSGVKRIDMRFDSKFDMKTAKQIAELAKSEKIDIINAQSSKDRYISMIVRKYHKCRAKIIHTRRQIPVSSISKLSGKLYSWGADHIVAVSTGVKDALMRMGIPGDQIKVINNGTPEEKFKGIEKADLSGIMKRFGINKDDKVIGCVSRHKQQEQLINALNLIDKPKLKVIFPGLERNELEDELIEKFPSRHEFIFCGKTDPKETLKMYRLFDLHVLPSITEGLSQSLLEAMYIGVPVIATDAGGNPDLIKDGESGYLFKENDLETMAGRIKHLLNNDEKYEKIKQNAKLRVLNKFTIESVVKNYEEFFQEIINRR